MAQFTVIVSDKDGAGEIPLTDTDNAQEAGDLAYSLCVAAKGHSFTFEIKIHAVPDEPSPPAPPTPPTQPPREPPTQPPVAGRTARPGR